MADLTEKALFLAENGPFSRKTARHLWKVRLHQRLVTGAARLVKRLYRQVTRHLRQVKRLFSEMTPHLRRVTPHFRKGATELPKVKPLFGRVMHHQWLVMGLF